VGVEISVQNRNRSGHSSTWVCGVLVVLCAWGVWGWYWVWGGVFVLLWGVGFALCFLFDFRVEVFMGGGFGGGSGFLVLVCYVVFVDVGWSVVVVLLVGGDVDGVCCLLWGRGGCCYLVWMFGLGCRGGVCGGLGVCVGGCFFFVCCLCRFNGRL